MVNEDWNVLVVNGNLTVGEVLRRMDLAWKKTLFVVDDDYNLLGSITDGDIRRALISGADMGTQATKIMNAQPVTARVGSPSQFYSKKMIQEEISVIPLLEGRRLVGIKQRDLSTHIEPRENPVFIMAGGFGSRLRPLTDNCPKPMLTVGERPILESIIRSFIAQGFHNFYISTHYLPEMIRDHFEDGAKWGVSIQYVYEVEPLGTGGALSLLPEQLPEGPLVMVNGDVLTNLNFGDLLEFHLEHDALATMCVREYEYQVPYGVVSSESGQLTNIVEKPIERYHVNAGMYVLDQKLLQRVSRDEFLDMPTLLKDSDGDLVMVYPFYDYWIDIGRIEDYNRANVDIRHLKLW